MEPFQTIPNKDENMNRRYKTSESLTGLPGTVNEQIQLILIQSLLIICILKAAGGLLSKTHSFYNN